MTSRPARVGPGSSGARHSGERWQRGLTLVELLIAASLACGLLAAAWGWVWTAAAVARKADGAAQYATAQAFAARMVRADLQACAALCPPEVGVCGPARLGLLCRDPLSGVERLVVVAWDPVRGVVWRNAAGSYLAEAVESFGVRYFGADGEEVVPTGGVLDRDERDRVRRVAVTWGCAAGVLLVEEDLP